ncbi:hypothetical protein DY000_02009807 [Brassica cretica]|uniref:Uncharacterized protein n=1 Tax=Brassica cretica TaxID=69181 RepID=A0ABQ7BXM7_BRACR|nr:hypothetical protein DY000_02009807 [Brassica cretica]
MNTASRLHRLFSAFSGLFRNCSYNDSHRKVCEKTAGDHEERGGSIVAINPRDKL